MQLCAQDIDAAIEQLKLDFPVTWPVHFPLEAAIQICAMQNIVAGRAGWHKRTRAYRRCLELLVAKQLRREVA